MSAIVSAPPPSPRTVSHTLPRGATVGRYVIVDLIGEGGMGVVYAAYDSQLDRKVAVKLLRRDIATGPIGDQVESRLLREAHALARLNHPNVITVYDTGTCDDGVFLAMEFVDGVTLAEWLRTPRPWRERLAVMLDAGRGLAAAHAAGLVHRDFKPENVLVRHDGRALVLDFGLARAASDTAKEESAPAAPDRATRTTTGAESAPWSSPLTEAGDLLGTIGYLPAEQVFGEMANAATDQFGFAATLYVALYGERPFPATNIVEYVDELYAPMKEPKGGKDVPPWLRRIVLRGLAAHPEARFPSVEAMLTELTNDPSIVRRRLVAVTLVVLLASGALAAAAFGLRQRELVCAADPTELTGVWDESVRGAMTQAFDKTGEAGIQSAGRVAKRLDEFRRGWTKMRADVCTATRVERQQPEEVFRLRNDCLDRERTEARAITRLLASADSQVVGRSLEIAYGLPQLSWCADVPTLRASAGLPDDPLKRAQVLDVRSRLADAESHQISGKLKDARQLATDAVTFARTTAHAATIAEALFKLGRVAEMQGDFAAAVPSLHEATLLASGAGAHAIAAQSAARLAYTKGSRLQQAAEARIWLEWARAALEQMGGNEELELDILYVEAAMLKDVEARPEQALPIFLRIVTTDRRLYGPHPKTVADLYNVGSAYRGIGDPARARPYFEEAAVMAAGVGGPNSAGVGNAKFGLAATLGDLGEIGDAETAFREAAEIFERNGMAFWLALAMEALADSALTRGDFASASQPADKALEALQTVGEEGFLGPVVKTTAGRTRITSNPTSAFELCREAETAQDWDGAIDPTKDYDHDALGCMGDALVALGRSKEAIPYLERSVTLERRENRGAYARAQFSLARALAASHRDPARALKLARAARDDFAKYPFLAFELRSVEDWLRANEERR